MKHIRELIIKCFAVTVVAALSLFLILFFVKGSSKKGELLYQHDYNTQVGSPFEASNSTARYALTESIVKDKSFFLNTDLARFASPDVVYSKGKFTSIFTPGISFVGVPLYMLGAFFSLPQLFSYATILLISFIDAFVIAKVSQKFGTGVFGGLIAGFCFLFATNALPYSLTFTQHTTSVLIILLGILNAMGKRTIINDSIFGALYGIGILVDIPNAFLLLPVLLYVFIRHFTLVPSIISGKANLTINIKFLFILFGLLPFIMFFGWYDFQTTGSYTQLGQTIGRATVFQNNVPQPANGASTFNDEAPKPIGIKLPFSTRAQLNGLYTLLISDERAWIYYCPIVFIGLLGLYLLYRKPEKRIQSMLCFSIVIIDVLLYSMFTDPWGGWAFGARYLIPAAAVLCIGIGKAVESFRKNVLFIPFFSIVLLYSIYISELGALTTSAIPPKVEAVSLLTHIPWTYQYNLNLIHTYFTSSLAYNLYFTGKMSPEIFLNVLVGGTFLLFVVLYICVLLQKGVQKKI